ncbi:MAG: amidophosphoribosyltransferase [Parcubacteria group bacterium Gr01-1014_48]|nr:MAG: amidophosphoribosyltransferase [Parcubacteria group bacterium Greene0416_14]TSC73519.1 MAG: amidophosphoribosyltransferase [Parcubacteria group bacterium Gr01-1014_48]TSD00084.1 MAG: amidophosphoribosyltransferase [Parcubacteria group bacterium Greene1014_15]TSD07323.1 MAG: amidophosphoribosyltransferase [Parcubacteria group bacterium Greene0714_4]
MCGIVGVWGRRETEASILAYLGSYAQQHRGQASAGIVSSDGGKKLYREAGLGLVREFFTKERLSCLPGHIAIGHNRYATTGTVKECNAQPLVAETPFGEVAIAHNGNLVNTSAVVDMLTRRGVLFTSTTDTEIILRLIATSKAKTLIASVYEALAQVEGAYSLVIMSATEMIAVRDPRGFRPLCIGKLEGGGYVFVSETCALDLIEATHMRDIFPGEIVLLRSDTTNPEYSFLPAIEKRHACLFELVYFARPDSNVFGDNVYLIRKAFGAELAREAPATADMVVPIPDSGVPAALGYSEALGIPIEHGLIRNHYVGRTFIEPTQSIRHFGVKVKHNAIRCVLAGKRVVVVDDSLVRGTTSKKLIAMIRNAGAREVHMRVGSPPLVEPCYYGIDTPTREEYIANTYNIEETRQFIGADSLQYLSYAGMLSVVRKTSQGYCTTCWTRNHPIHIL